MTARLPGRATPGAVAAPLRVSTLELFFDLVFAFTLTQLSAQLADGGFSLAAAVQVLLVFGVLWWMYGGYAWLTNTRAPDSTGTRLLLLLGMAGSWSSAWPSRAGSPRRRPGAAGSRSAWATSSWWPSTRCSITR